MLISAPVSTIVFGFDSAWTDKRPGAICAIKFDAGGRASFEKPRPARFGDARKFIGQERVNYGMSLIAIDQPTIVRNVKGMRPVEKLAARLVSYVGGGVQPAYRGGNKASMFGDGAPIWKFIEDLAAEQSPRNARKATEGHFLIEVFPALALTALEPDFGKRKGAPKYSPDKGKKFRLQDWKKVLRVIGRMADTMEIAGLASWANCMSRLPHPKKGNQDKLDAVLCVLIGLIWRSGPDEDSIMIGDLESGYMVTPVSQETRRRLEASAPG